MLVWVLFLTLYGGPRVVETGFQSVEACEARGSLALDHVKAPSSFLCVPARTMPA